MISKVGVVRVGIFYKISTNNLFQKSYTSKFSDLIASFHCEYKNLIFQIVIKKVPLYFKFDDISHLEKCSLCR